MDPSERTRRLWSLGDYGIVAARLAPAAEALVEAAGVSGGDSVLDVAAGTGNVTIAALARGAHVTASDIAPAMVEKGRARTGGEVKWHEADVQALPFDDDAFDRVLSAFGAIFAPDPQRAAGEMLRVGPVVGMTAWVQDGIQREAARVLDRYLPQARPPASLVPEQWGDHAFARAHFEAHGARVAIERRSLHWVFDGPEGWVDFMERGAPPVVAAKGVIGEAWPQARAELLAAVSAHGEQTAEGFVLRPEYLLIVARR